MTFHLGGTCTCGDVLSLYLFCLFYLVVFFVCQKMRPVEETFEDAGHGVEVSVVVEVGKGVDIVQEVLLEGVDVVLKHAINVSTRK